MKRLTSSIGFALKGIRSCFSREPNFKIHTAFAVLVIAAGLFFHLTNLEWIVIVLCIAAVLTTELVNTAIEELCNLIHREKHQGIKLIKDMSAAAVLLTAIAAAISGILIFVPKIICFLNQ